MMCDPIVRLIPGRFACNDNDYQLRPLYSLYSCIMCYSLSLSLAFSHCGITNATTIKDERIAISTSKQRFSRIIKNNMCEQTHCFYKKYKPFVKHNKTVIINHFN